MKDQEARNEIQQMRENFNARIAVTEYRLDKQIQMIKLLERHLGVELQWVTGIEAHYILVQKGDKQ